MPITPEQQKKINEVRKGLEPVFSKSYLADREPTLAKMDPKQVSAVTKAVSTLDSDSLKRMWAWRLLYGTLGSETQYGLTAKSNLFQVDPIGFRDTQNVKSHPGLASKFKKIKKAYGVEWPKVTYEQMTKDTQLGALAARLLYGVKKPALPMTRKGRAIYWKNLYNRSGKGKAGDYLKRTKGMEPFTYAPQTTMTKYAGERAPGIPDRDIYGDPRKLPKNVLAVYVLQHHKAHKAGPHYDLRIGDKRGMYSWAVPRGLPKPGEARLAVRTPMHSPKYNDFEGEIPRPKYGAGTVKMADKGHVVIEEASPSKIKFSIVHKKGEERYVLLKQQVGRNWLMVNVTPQKSKAHEAYKKVHYKVVPPEQVDKVLQGEHAVSAKIDGAAALAELMKDRLEVYSYRLNKDGKPILHTKRIGRLEGIKAPKALQGALLRGEIYGEREGKAISPQELGGILNASVANAIKKRQAQKVAMKLAVFDLLGDKRPYKERLEAVRQIAKALPKHVIVPPTETDPDKARRLFDAIRKSKHPLTSEGIVATPLQGGVPAKVKFRQDADVVIRDIFPAVTKGAPRAGGFYYSLPGGTEAAGKVGTGFRHEVLQDMLKHPDKYVGRTARISAQGQFPSGAYRAPSFIALHEG